MTGPGFGICAPQLRTLIIPQVEFRESIQEYNQKGNKTICWQDFHALSEASPLLETVYGSRWHPCFTELKSLKYLYLQSETTDQAAVLPGVQIIAVPESIQHGVLQNIQQQPQTVMKVEQDEIIQNELDIVWQEEVEKNQMQQKNLESTWNDAVNHDDMSVYNQFNNNDDLKTSEIPEALEMTQMMMMSPEDKDVNKDISGRGKLQRVGDFTTEAGQQIQQMFFSLRAKRL